MGQERFLKSKMVRQAVQHDDKLCAAIDRSRAFTLQFCSTFSQPADRQVDFFATVFESLNGHFVPIGIAVEQIHDGLITGRRFGNTRAPHPSGRATCSFDQVVDLRYTDTFECEGGFLYKELYQRQPRTIRNWIWEKLTFLPEWDGEFKCDLQFREFLRHIANSRYREAIQMVGHDPSLANRIGVMPRPGHGKYDPRVMLTQTTPAEYGAEFANREMIFTLHDAGVLEQDFGGHPPLCSSAIRGNLDTTIAMLELGHDIEVTDRHEIWPLLYASMWGRLNIVSLLIQRGADVNRQDNRGMTALFLADSKEIARQLLDAGAGTHFKDDRDRDCVAWHNEHGNAEIVELLVKYGARTPHEPLRLNEQQVMARGRDVFESLKETGHAMSSTMTCGNSVDWGFVLPIDRIPCPPHDNSCTT